ncbi:hypothetical protein EDD22DRAFT_842763 [Suillus occidentalis]|nr:hypothetical protein EDD22DRAFT_842763 [Suillus occidentalis]
MVPHFGRNNQNELVRLLLALLKVAQNLGINTINTTNNYSNGESEHLVAKFIKKSESDHQMPHLCCLWRSGRLMRLIEWWRGYWLATIRMVCYLILRDDSTRPKKKLYWTIENGSQWSSSMFDDFVELNHVALPMVMLTSGILKIHIVLELDAQDLLFACPQLSGGARDLLFACFTHKGSKPHQMPLAMRKQRTAKEIVADSQWTREAQEAQQLATQNSINCVTEVEALMEIEQAGEIASDTYGDCELEVESEVKPKRKKKENLLLREAEEAEGEGELGSA